jgi:hypothetical protein
MKRSPAPVVSREGCAPGVSVPYQTGNSRMARAMIACRTGERGGNREALGPRTPKHEGAQGQAFRLAMAQLGYADTFVVKLTYFTGATWPARTSSERHALPA